ncbi:hypothetical protein Tco_0288435 [Tanacetum coccineum]
MPTTRKGTYSDTIEQLIARRVAKELDAYEVNRNSGNGNGNGNGNGSGSQSDSGSGSKSTLHTARGCTYKEFLNCQLLNFKGTEGAVGSDEDDDRSLLSKKQNLEVRERVMDFDGER